MQHVGIAVQSAPWRGMDVGSAVSRFSTSASVATLRRVRWELLVPPAPFCSLRTLPRREEAVLAHGDCTLIAKLDARRVSAGEVVEEVRLSTPADRRVAVSALWSHAAPPRCCSHTCAVARSLMSLSLASATTMLLTSACCVRRVRASRTSCSGVRSAPTGGRSAWCSKAA